MPLGIKGQVPLGSEMNAHNADTDRISSRSASAACAGLLLAGLSFQLRVSKASLALRFAADSAVPSLRMPPESSAAAE
eukprot:scaffold7063_cov351-Pinguiococcus_pyrenoidosus.AAC.10